MNNRKIKFKAWRISKNEMIDNVIISKALLDDDYIVMQYTGIEDKNGKEIYEKDIIKIAGNKKYIGIIKWKNMGFIVDWQKDGIKHHLPDYVEIIGNIFENSNLLNK